MKRVLLLFFFAWSINLFSAPLHPANPYPADLATNVPANADLTWTPGDTELVRNGGFETGNATGWVRFNQGQGNGNNTYITNANYVPFSQEPSFPPFAGNFCALTDQDGPGLISMYQDVAVPSSANAVQLTWAHRLRNYFNTFDPAPPPDRQEYRVEIRTATDAILAVAYRTEPGDPVRTAWIKQSFDLTPYKGQTLRIVFLQEQWRSFFHLYYDNVSVRVRDTGPVTYDVYFGTNATPGVADFQGNVSAGTFPLPQLLPQRTYFWRVNARMGANVFTGPVWRFTTAPVGPLDHFTWVPIASPQSPGAPIDVTLSARDAAENLVTNVIGPVTAIARNVSSLETNSLLGEATGAAFTSFDNATVGYSFTPNTDMLVVGFRSDAGGKVSLWREDGVLLQGWPAQLLAGRTYRLGAYVPGTATNYLRFDGPSTFPHGTLNEAYEGTGDAFPTRPHPARWFMVDLIYAVPTLSEPIASSVVGFTGGWWNDAITVPSAGLVQLQATDASGQIGAAILFTVASNLRLELVRGLAGELSLRFPTAAGRDYFLETSGTLSTNSWVPFGSAISGTGSVIDRPVSPASAPAFFRLRTP
jgi:hypothetical protein